ncbi:ribosome-binding factor A [Pseudomonas saudimassiliensis]|uniref:Ribosome-binding factor A n=1 Tax=Pseudomonas saudimassiliensis TaxID=1461581 RepID=A0A078MPK5_9PSED|nr:30S ribosome-binding factor RbfA [Pseudomonas saudimassiliensis]CEA06791.1 ribosome-binding factor A [Pseudomonas saudimassiliensis]CEF28090.1 ribosome-binding factor A [Pseudomonas saudimassiliensis]
MAKEYSRTQRVADQMQRELAVLIQREVRDPRVGMITVTAAEVSRDLAHAKIFITLMGEASDEDIALNLAALKDAAGFLRVQLGRVMKLRSIPQLHFHYDESVRRGVHLSSLIERAVAQDRQRSGDDEE